MRGPANVPEADTKTNFVAYTTILTRVASGIPVPDSFAAARFNQNDETSMEWMYWPAISQQVIDDAVKLKAMLDDGPAQLRYLALLPEELAGLQGEVTIRHSDFADPKFVAFASYDVHDIVRAGRTRGGTRNFDIHGVEVTHPNRRPNDVPVPSAMELKQ